MDQKLLIHLQLIRTIVNNKHNHINSQKDTKCFKKFTYANDLCTTITIFAPQSTPTPKRVLTSTKYAKLLDFTIRKDVNKEH